MEQRINLDHLTLCTCNVATGSTSGQYLQEIPPDQFCRDIENYHECPELLELLDRLQKATHTLPEYLLIGSVSRSLNLLPRRLRN